MAGAKPQTAFDREFRGHIERFREPLVAALRKLVATPLPAVGFGVLSFEVQSDWRDFPVYAFAMDRDAANEEYFEPPFKGKVLPKAGRLIPEGAIDQDRYEDAGVATFERGARVLATWFGGCWHAAGGASFPLPAYIHLHGSARYYNLRARRWVRADQIGRQASSESGRPVPPGRRPAGARRMAERGGKLKAFWNDCGRGRDAEGARADLVGQGPRGRGKLLRAGR